MKTAEPWVPRPTARQLLDGALDIPAKRHFALRLLCGYSGASPYLLTSHASTDGPVTEAGLAKVELVWNGHPTELRIHKSCSRTIRTRKAE